MQVFTLKNGLTVIVEPESSSPTVAVSITYRVGSQHERPGRSGFAHLFEHLMFQGTKNLKPDEITKLVESNGGVQNAYTMKTNTTYHSLVPKNVLPAVLWAEADRMSSLLVDGRALALEQDVVLEEMRRNYLNKPYTKAFTAGMGAAAFSKWENRHTTIGEAKDIHGARLEDVRAFYEAHYAPNNAALALVGDITVSEAKKLVELYFGPLPPRPVQPLPDLAEPPMEGERRVQADDPWAKIPRALAAWRIPERGGREFWALSLLMDILSGGEASPLYQALVKRTKLAVSTGAIFPWWTDHTNIRGPELCGLDIMLKPNASVDAALKEADKIVARFAKKGPTAAELARVKTQAEFIWLNDMQFLLDRAKILSSYTALIGDPKGLKKDLKTMTSIRPAEVRAACAKWLVGKGRAVVHIVPAAPVTPKDDFGSRPIPEEEPRPKGEAPPPIGPAPEVPIPRLHRFTLKNGLRVVLVQDRRFPLAELRLSLPAGRTAEEQDENGLSFAASELILKGTKKRDGAGISNAVARLGYSLHVEAGMEFFKLSAAGLSKNAARFFAVVNELLTEASYPKAEVELWKENALERLKLMRSNPDIMARERVKSELFPNHPYSKGLLEDQTVLAVETARLKRFHERALCPDGAFLVLVSPLSPSAARPMLEKAFNRWKNTARAPQLPSLIRPKTGRTVIVNRPGSVQANLVLAQTIELTPQHPDYLAFNVMNHLLGGSSSARLFQKLRGEKGYTYGSYSAASSLRLCLSWSATAETRNDVSRPALEDMLGEVRKMREGEPSDRDLTAAKRYLGGLFTMRLASMERIANYLWSLEQSGLPAETYMKSYLARLEALNPADIQAAARRYLQPESLLTVIVGDEKALEPAISAHTAAV